MTLVQTEPKSIKIGSTAIKKVTIRPNGTEKQIRPAGWTPGANTIAYYQFDNNLNDSSGNGKNLTLKTGSVTYNTASGGGKYAYFNRNTWTNNTLLGSMNVNASDGYTVSFYWQAKELLSLNQPNTVADICNGGASPVLLRISGSIGCRGAGGGNDPKYDATLNTWYHAVFIRYNGYNKLYINGSLIASSARSETSGNYNITLTLNQVGNTNSSSYSNNNYLGEFIIENKARTDTEIADYYNLTKSLYGIS